MKLFPPQLKAEVKFSTGSNVSIPEREWQALYPESDRVVGFIAVLCLVGDHEIDGHWVLLDPMRAFPGRKTGAISLALSQLARIGQRQKHLQSLHDALEDAWRPYLHGYLAYAIGSRADLQSELERRYRARNLAAPICADPILNCDHLNNLRQIVNAHGEGVAGGVFQDLFAYLLAYLGYTKVVSNAIGVPDITASGLTGNESVTLSSFNRSEIERMAQLCEKAGDVELAGRLRGLG
jgi:hypothetical protein